TPSFEIPLPNFTLTGNSSQKILQTTITCTFHRPTQPQRLSPKSMISLTAALGGTPYFLGCRRRFPLGNRSSIQKKKKKKATPISTLNGPNGVALSDTNKTDLIAKSLESQFQLNNIQNPQKDHIISNIVETYITDHTNNTDPIPPALPSEGKIPNLRNPIDRYLYYRFLATGRENYRCQTPHDHYLQKISLFRAARVPSSSTPPPHINYSRS
ncbi:hypothetical protein TNCV_1470531, partial [Trichonephila clavipes]